MKEYLSDGVKLIDDFQNTILTMQGELLEFKRQKPHADVSKSLNRLETLNDYLVRFDALWTENIYLRQKYENLMLITDELTKQVHELTNTIKAHENK
jgi:archaellum component FlaC